MSKAATFVLISLFVACIAASIFVVVNDLQQLHRQNQTSIRDRMMIKEEQEISRQERLENRKAIEELKKRLNEQ